VRDHVLTITPNAADPDAEPRQVTFRLERSVHGPIQARAKVGGRPVAIAEARSSYFHDLDSAVAFKLLNSNQVRDAASFQRAMGRSNLGFAWFYADDRDIAYLQAGWYPRRARGTDPSLPAWGTGAWDWQGFDPSAFTSRRLGYDRLPKDRSPGRGYIVNWNNKQAPGWRAADDRFSLGSVHRSDIFEDRIKRAFAGAGSSTSPHSCGSPKTAPRSTCAARRPIPGCDA
jgi:acyl-homoserine lactone acylase PvdQ